MERSKKVREYATRVSKILASDPKLINQMLIEAINYRLNNDKEFLNKVMELMEMEDD